MIEFALMCYICKSFYSLAHEHDKNKLLFAVLGVVTYYGGTIVGAALIGIFAPNYVNEMNNFMWGLLGLPIGLLCVHFFYFFLKKNWNKKAKEESRQSNANILDDTF